MKRFAAMGACLVVMCAVGVLGAAPAWAAEGPLFKVNGVRLNGERAIKAKLTEEYVLKILAPMEVVVRCKEMTYGSGTIRGLNEKTSDTGKGVVNLKMCAQEGNGLECKLEKDEIKTQTLTSTLAYSEPARKGKVLILFTGTPIGIVKFVGEGCSLRTCELEGSFAGEVLDTTRKSIVAEGTQSEAVVNYVKFPTGHIGTVYTETSGVVKTITVELDLHAIFVFETTITGESELELGPSIIWSAYTKP